MRRMIKGLLLHNSKSNVLRHKTVRAFDDKEGDDEEDKEEDGDGDDDVIDSGDGDDDDVNIFYCGIIDIHKLQR